VDCILNYKCAKVCGTQCVDIKTNTLHCGKCNNACGAKMFCVQGKCTAVTPATVAPGNLVLWLAADKGITTSGGKVTRWADQSTNGLDATASSGYEPTLASTVSALNNQPALVMNKSFFSCGNSKLFNIATPSLFAVTSGVTGGIIFTKSFGSGGTLWRKLELTWKIFRSGADSNGVAHNATMSGANILALVSSSNTSHTVSVNGKTTSSSSTLYHSTYNTADFKIGGSKAGLSSLSGNLAEIVIYNKALSATERSQVECYLGQKYGITVSGCP
jgi:hypothetical protein